MIQNTFQKQYNDFFNAGLNPTEVAILTFIYNRYQLSENNKQFFDQIQNDYYVIFPVSELKQKINVSESTVKRTLKGLQEKNWIILKRAKNSRVNLIFIVPDKKVNKSLEKELEFKSDEELEQKSDNCNNQNTNSETYLPNNDEHNRSTRLYNTNINFNQVKLIPSNSSNCSSIKTDLKNINNTYRLIKDTQLRQNQQKLSEKALATSMKRQGLSDDVIGMIQTWTEHDVQKQREVKNTIFKAKYVAEEKAQKQNKMITLEFENTNFDYQNFSNQLNVILVHAYKQATNPIGYLFIALTNYFEKEINRELHLLNQEKTTQDFVTEEKIPLMKW